MNQHFHRSPSTGLRVFNACLLSFLLIMMPFAQMAAARGIPRSAVNDQGSDGRQQTADRRQQEESGRAKISAEDLFVNPPAMPAVGLTATKTDATATSPALPGDTITYTVDVNNPTAGDATGVTFNDIIDSQTTRFGADFDLKVSPLAINDTYSVATSGILTVPAPGVLTNDTGVPAPSVTAVNGSGANVGVPISVGGGTLTLNSDGSFSYSAPAAQGPVNFTYTIGNGQTPPSPGVDDTATVTINVDAAPTVSSTTPTNGATDQATTTNISITFSEAVNVTGNWFQIVCTSSSTRNVADTVVTPNGSNTVFTIDPNTDFTQGETCTVTVDDAAVTDQDSNDPPDNMAADYVFSFTMDAAPSVLTTTPTNTATGVATNSNVVVNFSESVNATTSSFTISCATSGAHTYTLSASPNSSFTLNPNADFANGELCTVTVVAANTTDADANDPPNNMLSDYVFSFTTDTPPTVTAITPTNGAINQTTNTDITLTFSESVSLTAAPVTISCTTSGAHNAYTVSASPNTSFTINPNVDFSPGETCTVTVLANQVSDTDTGDPPDNMTANFVSSFSTDAAPTVTTTVPLNGANPVATNTNITINFSEAVNVTTNSFTIECPSPGNLQTFTVSGTGTSSITLDPTADLPVGTLCTVTVVANQVSDADANDPPDNMSANFVFSFTTDSPPSVNTTVPANNATNVALGATITVNFSESVAATGSSFTIVCTNAGARTFTLSASPSTSFTLTPTVALPAGDDCTVTVIANQISDSDTADPPDNMVADYVFSFKVQPDAINDLYPVTLVGNVSTNSFAIPFSVTTNDVSAAAFTISAVQANSTIVANTITTTSANGGNIVMTVSGADRGKFTYDPPAGFEGTDTFTYTISRTDGGGTDTATVSMPISGMVWFINNNAASCLVAGCGRLSNPFSTLAAFNTLNNGTGNNPAANDNIFVYESVTGYTGAVTLLNGQRFIGQDATASLSTITGLTPPSGSPSFPAMNTGAPTTNITSTVTMDTNSTVRGLSINVTGTSSGLVASSETGLVVNDVATISAVNTPGVAVSFTSSSGTFTFTNISASGSAAGLSFASSTSGSTVTGNNITTVSGAAFTTSSSGTTDFTFNDVTSTTGTAVSVTTSTGDYIFHAITATGPVKGITVTSATGTFTVNGTSTTDASGGTIQNATSRGAEFISSNNITLKNMNFTNNGVGGSDANCADALGATTNSGFVTSATCESNLHLQTVTNVTLNNLNITDGDSHGINGIAVNGMTMTSMDVERNGDEVGEDGVQLVNTLGTVTISGSNTFKDNAANQFEAQNGSGTVTFTITGAFFGLTNFPTTGAAEAPSPGASTGNNGLQISASGSANMTTNVTGSTFEENYADGYFSDYAGTATMNITVGSNASANTFTNNGIGIEVAGNSTGAMTYVVQNNTITNDTTVTGIFTTSAMTLSRSGAGAVWTGTVDNNNIGTNSAGATYSGCFVTNCAGMEITDGATANTNAYHATITNNEIYHVQFGIVSNIGGTASGAPKTSLVITGNTIGFPDVKTPPGANTTAEGNAIHVNSGTLSTNVPQTCVEISSNTLNGNWGDPANHDSLRLRSRGAVGSTFRIRNWNGVGGDAGAMSFLESINTINPGAGFDKSGFQVVVVSFTGGSGACPLLLADADIEGGLGPVAPPVALKQEELDSMVAAAMDRWATTGLTSKQLADMRELRFEIGDLGQAYLGEADGNRIVVDRDAQGKGWFIDSTPVDDLEFGSRSSATRSYANPFTAAAGRIDLLTAIEHEIGHKLGLDDLYLDQDRDSVMYGYLTVGERRLPAMGQAIGAKSDTLGDVHYLKLKGAEAEGSRKNHAATTRALAPMSGETLNYIIGTLPAGKHVRLTFKVTINLVFTGNQVSNQGSVTSNLGTIQTDDPDVPPNTGETDPTVTPVVGPPDAVDDNYATYKNTTLNVPAPGVLANDANVTSVTAVNGTGPCLVGSPCSTTNGSVTMISDGSFTYTPTAGYTGPDSFTYTATGTGADTATVNITVVDTSAIYINEVLFNPPGTDAPNEYIELRGLASSTIPAGTYFVAIEGDADNPGDVKTIINLSGLTFGTNGFLVLLQMSNTYVPAAGATVVTSTTVGFGGLPGSRWSADASATDLPDASTTFMLIQTGVAPTLTDDFDSANDGGFDGAVYPGWSVRDSISAMNGSANAQAYGAFSFRNTAGSGTGQGGEVIVPFIPSYVGRNCNSTGSTAADWVASGVLGGAAPNWTLGSAGETEPSGFAGKALNHIGSENFANVGPTNSVPGAQVMNEDTTLTFNAGNANLISISDPDAGGADMKVTLTATNGTFSLSGTTGLAFTVGDGIADPQMVFTGSITNINNALNGLVFTSTPNFSGAASLSILTEDQGNSGCGGNLTDSDTINITVNPDLEVSIKDAQVAEPGSGSANMVFTVVLSAPAPGAVSVNFQTSDGTANDGVGEANQDYTATSGTVNFSLGQQVKTISVPVLSDADNAEVDETFLVDLSTNVGADIGDGQATGTITVANPAGTFLISELRTSGPNPTGSTNEFVELYNNSNSPVTVSTTDGSPGWGLFKMGSDCSATPVLIGTIPNGTVIPARGHYLMVGSTYSLANYGGSGAAAGNLTLTADIESDANVAIFNTANVANLSALTRLDAVGFGLNTGSNCDLLREGSTLQAVAGSTTEHSFFRKLCDFNGGCTTPGIPKDTNDNSADFMLADTAGTNFGPGQQHLGAPGPENLTSPLRRDPAINLVLLDATVSSASPPNRVRDLTADAPNASDFGTLSVRRRVVNNTGANVTRLRFRIVELTTFPSPGGGQADLRARGSSNVVVSGVNDMATCFAATGSNTTPCMVTVKGTTLEQPPTQPANIGGGYNATLAEGTITTGTPLANGASTHVQFLLGVKTTGTFRFLIIVEALP
jgi:methionine-rich copper-binding protein CopC